MREDPTLGQQIDRTLLATGLVTVGTFQAPVHHPKFHDSGPTTQPVFVFPRTYLELRYEGSAPFTVDTCTVVYYNRGQRYTREPLDPRGDLCDWFSVRPDVLCDVVCAYDPSVRERPQYPFAITHGPCDSATYALQRQIVRYVQSSPAPDALAVEETVLEVLRRVFGTATRACSEGASNGRWKSVSSRRRTTREIVAAARAYLLEHYPSAVSLEDVARAAHCSVYHLCRVFRAERGITVHEYLMQLRLRRSLEMVADLQDLTTTALRLGFSSHSHLTASFRRTFRLTPSQFRNRVSSRVIRELAERLACPAMV